MQYYLDENTNELLTESEIKARHPETSFPIPFGEIWQYKLVFNTPQPITTELQVAYIDGTEIDSKGNLVTKWTVKDKFNDYTNEEGFLVTKAEQEVAYTTQLAEEKIKAARESMTNAVQTLVDSKAREFRWDDIKSARAGAGVPLEGTESAAEVAIHTEAVKLAKWDRAVWAKANEIEAAVLAGTIEIPTVEELLAELPVFV